jgi:multidrug efflux pump subunit AcrB
MMDFSKWAFKNRNLVYFCIAVLVVGGILACYQMSKLEDPEIKVKQAMVVTTYPGASAHQVELEVTDVLEKKIRTMNNVDNVESYSYNDLSLMQVELKSTVPDKDVEQYWDMLRRKVNDARASLPDGATAPVVKDDFGSVFGIFYALTGDGLTDRALADYAEMLKREVNDVDGVERVDIYGKRTECINISLLQDRMANLGVKPIEVLNTLNGQNKTTYTGYFDNGDNRIRVTVSDKFKTVDDISMLLIQGHDDDQLRLRDIARIEKGYDEPTRNEMFYDGERALGLLISARSGTDIVKVGSAVEARLEQLKENRLPAGVELHKIFFQPDRVGDSLGTFVVNLIESVLIVIVILMIAMGFKSGLTIGISLVVTVFGSFLFLYSSGGTMQRVSLAAFVLAMGMLVDNAIVIIDGILVDLKAGKDRMEAMTAIGRQTAMPLLGATLIAILAFLPIYMSPDTAGVYVRDLFIVLAVSLLLSWVLALVHVPLMANRRLFPKVDTNPGSERVYEGRTYDYLRRALRFGLRHRWGTVATMLVLLVLTAFGYRFVRQGFFPDMEYDQLYMEYKLPEGSNYTRIEKDLTEIQQYLKTRPEVTHITASLGGTPGRYNLVRSVAYPSLAYGELIIDFTSPRELVANMDEIQRHLTETYPDAYVKLKRYNLMFKKYPIEVQFLGPDPAVLHALADSARAIMQRIPEVCLITSDWDPKVPVLTVEYDQPAARSLGLSRNDVSMSLLTATSGLPIGSFYEGIHKNLIYVKCLDDKGLAIEDLGNAQVFATLPSVSGLLDKELLVKLQSGNIDKEEIVRRVMGSTPLKQISKRVDVEWEDPVVPRYNGQRSHRVECSPAPGIETEKARAILAQQIEQIPLPEGYSLKWQGEKAASDRSMKYLFLNFPLAIILMIAILIMLFGDYRKPLIIFCCLPMILVGVVAVMLITGKTFNFVAIVGTLGLIGMLIKNGIVLMDEITLQLRSGKEPIAALIDSSQSRLRPVMMASLTTILGMIPLLTDAMFGSLAAAIMGGLLFSTLITLVVIPILYALFFKIENKE